jgi:hypothetical protein
MRLGDSGIHVYSGLHAPIRRRVEKARASKALDDAERRENRAANLNPATRAARTPSRYGTRADSVTCQNGVTCGFAAQILGQILGTNRADTGAAVNAYTRNAGNTGAARIVEYA